MTTKPAVTLAVLSTGTGKDCLSNKDAVEGLSVQLDGAEPIFVSWRSLPRLIAYEMGKRQKVETRAPTAVPANGPTVAAK